MPTRRRKPLSPVRKALIAGLLVISGAALLAPPRWTASLMSLVQWIVPVEHAIAVVVDAADGEAAPPSELSAEECSALQESNASLENQTAALTARIEELEREVQTLTATRLWDADGRRLGSRGRLIPARVLGEDVVAWRSSRLLTAGTWQGVRDGQAVLNRGEDAAVRPGLAILLGQVLVGTIEQTATHTSRVRLVSDVSTQMKVRLGRFTDGRFALLEPYFWLTGRGGGRMEIREVDKRDVDSGAIRVGDVVLSDPQNEMLPAALTIGRVAEISPDRDKPLLVILSVRAAVASDSLHRVYVYDPTAENP